MFSRVSAISVWVPSSQACSVHLLHGGAAVPFSLEYFFGIWKKLEYENISLECEKEFCKPGSLSELHPPVALSKLEIPTSSFCSVWARAYQRNTRLIKKDILITWDFHSISQEEKKQYTVNVSQLCYSRKFDFVQILFLLFQEIVQINPSCASSQTLQIMVRIILRKF